MNMKPRSFHITFVITVLFECFALLPTPKAFGVVPAPDGGYPGGNTAEGQNALQSITTGGFNMAAGYFSLFANSTGSFNTAVGAGALDLNTASNNTATGAAALLLNTTGTNNTANGVDALVFNTIGGQNTATGAFALFFNTTGENNTAVGFNALSDNSIGSDNTAIGNGALIGNTASQNTATGSVALASNTTGAQNTASGFEALVNNTMGNGNTANGLGALAGNTTGNNNTAVGDGALANNTSGSDNTVLGSFTGVNISTANNVICIGADGQNVDNSCYIGNIFGATSVMGAPVLINSNNKLGTMTSSKRFKEDIKPMDKASEALFSLNPVAFRYKKEIDPARTSQLGLVAEEVQRVNPDLVVRDQEGKPYTVRYDQVNAMLLNEFLKEHRAFVEEQRKVQDLQATVTQLRKDVETVVAHAKEQDSKIQKVNDQVGVIRNGIQIVQIP
jgi:hypothetical protein